MNDTKRETLKQKVAAAEARNQARAERSLLERAGDSAVAAKDKFTSFAKQHPVATVAGGLAIGVLISALFKNSPTRKLGGRAAGFAALGAELALSYAARSIKAASEAGHDGIDWLGERGQSVGSSAADYASSARETVVDAGKSAARAIRSRLN